MHAALPFKMHVSYAAAAGCYTYVLLPLINQMQHDTIIIMNFYSFHHIKSLHCIQNKTFDLMNAEDSFVYLSKQ